MSLETIDPKELNHLYNRAIDQFESDVDTLDIAFDSLCEAIRSDSHSKLNALTKDDLIGRRLVLAEEKDQLDRVLWDLKTDIKRRSKEMRDALEAIQARKDALESESGHGLSA